MNKLVGMIPTGHLSRNDRIYIQFMTSWPEIKVAIEEGWTYIRIWRLIKNEGKIGFCYKTFLSLARRQQRLEAARVAETAKPNDVTPEKKPPTTGFCVSVQQWNDSAPEKEVSSISSTAPPGEERPKKPSADDMFPKVDHSKLDTTGRRKAFGMTPEERRNFKAF